MASPRKLAANRANAKRSTGPRSHEGKAKVAGNALRHGLAISVYEMESSVVELERLAEAILKSFNHQGDRALAARVAEAQLELNWVRQARRSAFILYQSGKKAEPVVYIDTYSNEYPPIFRTNSDIPFVEPVALDQSTLATSSGDISGVGHFAMLLKQLSVFDRYEKRALSRRKTAMRAFDLSLTVGQSV